MKTLCITGNRDPFKNKNYKYYSKEYKTLLDRVKVFIIQLEITDVMIGMAVGIDTAIGLLCIDMKKNGYDINIHCAIPCLHHNEVLFGDALEYYSYLLENASSEKVVTETEYTPKVMQIRNIYMVDNSDIVLGVWNGGKGGTLNCLKYAVKTDKEIYILNPLSLDYTHINKN